MAGGSCCQKDSLLAAEKMGSLFSHEEQTVQLDEEWEVDKCHTEVLLSGKAFYIHHLLSEVECKRFKELMETSSEKVTDIGSSVESYRYCSRLISRQQEAMDKLWTRLEPLLGKQGVLQLEGQEGSNWSAVGLNEMVRVVKYQLGGRFAPHCDSCYTRSVEERSWWTVSSLVTFSW